MSIPKGFKPMLSGTAPEDLSLLKYPFYVSPKLDGIRGLIFGGVAYSRNMKPLPNKRIQALAKKLPDGLDGEFISGDMRAPDAWNRTQSCVMKAKSEDEFTFHVFDWFRSDGSHVDDVFKDRFAAARKFCLDFGKPDLVRYVKHDFITKLAVLAHMEDGHVRAGFEGTMIRACNGPYKFGRSTTREGHLLKLKRFDDAEAIVVGVVEKLHNANEAKKDELGRTKRSSAKAGKKPTGMMGALVCYFRDEYDNRVEFELGTGFDDKQRLAWWHKHKRNQVGRPVVKFKYQGLTPDGKPRFPVFLGFRDARDI